MIVLAEESKFVDGVDSVDPGEGREVGEALELDDDVEVRRLSLKMGNVKRDVQLE